MSAPLAVSARFPGITASRQTAERGSAGNDSLTGSIMGDINGDGKADFQIEVHSASALLKADSLGSLPEEVGV
jgi:hypothetical protein